MKNNKEKILAFIEEISIEEKPNINICVHSSPDPDATSSALAMSFILSHYGFTSTIYYDGEISHPQNKTIMNVLNISMHKAKDEIDGYNVCVDCTPHNSVAKNALLVIDHHKNQNDKSKYTIIHSNYGACATIMWELIKELELDVSEEENILSTALLLGIRTDTNDLISENMSKNDFIAYQELLDKSDKEAIQKVMNYPFPRYLYEKRLVLHEEGNSTESNGVFIGGIGMLPATQRDSIAILAEEYARMESVQTAVIFAITDKKFLEVSVRSSNVSLDVNQMCADLFGDFGGGTSYKGGAKIPLYFYSDIDDKNSQELWKITCKHMFKKVLKESYTNDKDEN